MELQKERILLVENDPEISDLISRQTLQPMGYQVEVVGAAAAAISQAVRFAPDVIIANLNLQGLSGKDLLVALNSQGVDAPIIVIAPKGMESDVVQAFRLGATDFLSWPIREAEVVSAVERVLRQGRARREREVLSRQLSQTNQELQRRVRELTTIFGVGKAVISITNQQSLFEKIIEGAVFVTEADSAWMLVRDERGKNFILRACRSVPAEILARLNQPFDDGLSSLVALSGENLSIHGDPLKRFKVARLAQAALVVPVKVRKEVVGILVVVRKTPQPFSTNQQGLLEAIADYASISLVNTRLFRALEERVNALQQAANSATINEGIKDDILHQASQEFHKPLKILSDNVDLLLSKDQRKLNPEQTIALGIIQEKSKSLLAINESLARIEQGEKSKQRELIDLNELIRQAINRFQAIARQSQTAIQADLPSKPVLTLVYPNQISKALDGLISNALKYSQPKSQITLRAENKENQVWVSVQDSGIGIEEKHLEHLFDKGYKIDGATSGRFGGVGISLAYIKEIIDANGGKVWAESHPGKGSIFYFSLTRMVR